MLLIDYFKYLFKNPEIFIMENIDILIEHKKYILSSKWENMVLPIRMTTLSSFEKHKIGNTLGTMIQLWSGNWKLNDNEYITYTVGTLGGSNFNSTWIYQKNKKRLVKICLENPWKLYAEQAEKLHQ